VSATSKFIKDFINLITSNFDESGSVVLPDLFARVVSSDAIFECVSSNLARKVKLCRQDTVVGPKRLIYAIDSADNTRDSTRAKTKDFFKNELGFEDSEIHFVERSKFYKDQAGIWQAKFSDEE
jgi:hypothetical protein